MYHYGDLEIISAEYVGVVFSDHLSLVFTIKVPQQLSRLLCPKNKPLFKANPDVIRDKIFQARLKDSFALWSGVGVRYQHTYLVGASGQDWHKEAVDRERGRWPRSGEES